MNSKKRGGAYCQQSWQNRLRNWEILLREIRYGPNIRKVWAASCARYREEQGLAGKKGADDD
jgi:hypothetical protein